MIENLIYALIAIVVVLLLVRTIYNVGKKSSRDITRDEITPDENLEPVETILTTQNGERYRAILNPGTNRRIHSNWKYYKMNSDDDLFEVFDILLIVLLWDAFNGDDGDFTFDDSEYFDELSTDTNGVVAQVEDSVIENETLLEESIIPEPEANLEVETISVVGTVVHDGEEIEIERSYTPEPTYEDTTKVNASSSYGSSSSSYSSGTDSSSSYDSGSSSDSGGSSDD